MPFALLNLSLAALATLPADTKPRLRQVETRFAVIEPFKRGERVITQYERLFEIPLRWRQGAIMAIPVGRNYGKRIIRTQEGQALARTAVSYQQDGFSNALTFCLPRASYEGNPLAYTVWKSTIDGQYCVIDRDGDGSVDHDMLLNAGEPDQRMPRPITPVVYTLEPGATIGKGDSLWVRYDGGANFYFAIEQSGRPLFFKYFRYEDKDGRHVYDSFIKGQKQPDGSYRVEVPSRVLTVTDIDKQAKTARVTWEDETSTQTIPVPDLVL